MFVMQDTLLWTEKHFPKALDDFVGNAEIVDRTVDWAESWNKGLKRKPLLFHGPSGSGKTCLALLACRHYGWDLFELNASDLRDKDAIERLCGSAALNSTFSGKPRLILLDEIDGLQSRDRGGHAAIMKILKESQNPVILTANDLYADQKIAGIRFLCDCLQFKKINYLSIAKFLRAVAEQEGVKEENDALKMLARNSAGDLRSALLDLQCLALDDRKITDKEVNSLYIREKQENIFNVLRLLFKSRDFQSARQATANSEVDSDMLVKWVEENIPAEFNSHDLPKAFEWLSRADLFDGRIYRRQHWGFKKYSKDLATAGVALSKSGHGNSFVRYSFPKILQFLKASKALRGLKKQVASKIGKKMHSSAREVIREDLPFFSLLMKDNEKASRLSALFDFNEDDLSFLLDAKKDSKKVIEILAKASEIKQAGITAKRKFSQPLSEEALEFAEKEMQAAVEAPQEKQVPLKVSKGQAKLF
ncbi:replication factor C large subunit [archaeon]|nr:replication factor C large subunit [archaeon]